MRDRLLAVFVPFVQAPTTHIGLDGLGSILALGVLGSGVAYALNHAVVRAAGATVASTVTYVIPVFATILGPPCSARRCTGISPPARPS